MVTACRIVTLGYGCHDSSMREGEGMDEAVDRVRNVLAERMYLAWCQHTGNPPRRPGYVPPQFLDYADVAVDFLGVPDDMLDVVPS